MSGADIKHLELDKLQEKRFLQYYHQLQQKHATLIRIFDWGEVYSVHGKDSVFIQDEIFKDQCHIQILGKEPDTLKYIVFKQMKFESLLRELLLVRHYRVELHQHNANKTSEWDLSFKGSPGNLVQFEDILFANHNLTEGSGLLALKLVNVNKSKVLGVAFIDTSLYQIKVAELIDNDNFSALEAILVQLGAKECVIMSSSEFNSDLIKIRKIIERSDLLVTERKRGEFSDKDIEQDLNRILHSNSSEQKNCRSLPELSLTHAMCALSALIRYLELSNDAGSFNQYRMSTFDHSLFIKLDVPATRALNLFPSQAEGGNSFHSLYGLLNRCKTSQGERLLSHWIRQPLMDLNRIEERLNLVEALVENTELRMLLFDELLKQMPDFLQLAKKFQKKSANLQDCYKVYLAIEKIPTLIECLEKHAENHLSIVTDIFTNPLKEVLMDFANFQSMVQTTLDMSLIEAHEFLIKPEFDEQLQELRQKIDEVESAMNSQLNYVARDLGLEAQKSLKLESNTIIGYFFRVTKKDEKVLRNNDRYTILEANKAGVRFRNKRLTNLNDDYLESKSSYESQQKCVVEEIINIAAGYSDPMHRVSDIIALLDVITSFSQSSANAPSPYVRPKMLAKGQGVCRLTQARHPCLEMQDDISYIPNDIDFHKEKNMFYIITGPNMGGKSTFIRSAGVITLMAHIGCFVPCSEAEISIVDAIMARVGAGDNQQKGVSTFMAEMLEVSSILKTATKNSLVIIDELGRGTSTYDGFGLAWAISEYICKEICCFCLFATHFHELTELSKEIPFVTNVHMSALTSNDTLTLLYRVKPGVCDQSFGIHVAEMANFPEHVLKDAKKRIKRMEYFKNVDLAGTGLEGSDETVIVRRKQEQEKGEKIISKFLDEVRIIAEKQLDESSLCSEMTKLREQINKNNNLFIKDLLLQDISV